MVSEQAPSWNMAPISPSKVSRKKLIDEFCLVEIIDDFAVNKILEFVGAGQVVDRNDLIAHTALVERL